MISTRLYFEQNLNLDRLTSCLSDLPELIKPTYFSEDEGKVSSSDLVSDDERFKRFREENPDGFFVSNNNGVLFDISTPTVGYSALILYADQLLSNELIESFFRAFVELDPIFGFACESEEYEHRNRYYTTIGINEIESWIGRDLNKYLSGIYWYTLLTDRTLNTYGLNLDEICILANNRDDIASGIYLLNFFERADDWQKHKAKLDGFCQQTEGVFSKYDVELAVQGVSSYFEYGDIVANWR